MADIIRYAVENEHGDGDGSLYELYQEAMDRAYREGGQVIEHEYEFAHSLMVADFTGSDG